MIYALGGKKMTKETLEKGSCERCGAERFEIHRESNGHYMFECECGKLNTEQTIRFLTKPSKELQKEIDKGIKL